MFYYKISSKVYQQQFLSGKKSCCLSSLKTLEQNMHRPRMVVYSE